MYASSFGPSSRINGARVFAAVRRARLAATRVSGSGDNSTSGGSSRWRCAANNRRRNARAAIRDRCLGHTARRASFSRSFAVEDNADRTVRSPDSLSVIYSSIPSIDWSSNLRGGHRFRCTNPRACVSDVYF